MVAAEVEEVLKQIEDVVREPKVDHSIRLNEGATPINFRLYRYPAPHKDIIDNLVNEMLASG